MGGSIDLQFAVDSCHFVILHPLDHRRIREEGNAFFLVEDSIDTLLERGLLLGLQLGADGYKAIRVVVGPLPSNIASEVEEPFVFRLHVRHGRMFVADPGYDFPTSAELAATSDEDLAKYHAFFDVPNGRYRASLYPLRKEAFERENVIWLLALEVVDTFDGVAAWRDFPNEESPHRTGETVPAPKARVRVRHGKYGLGWVVEGKPGDAGAVTVAFDEHGEKKIAGTFLTPEDAANA